MKSIVTPHLEEFTHEEGFFTRDRRALDFFQYYPKNDDPQDVLLKAMEVRDARFIDFQTHADLADHIVSLEIDADLSQKDPRLVNRIAQVDIKGHSRQFYPFASRYCNYHHPDDYPIYSETMIALLIEYAQEYKHLSLTIEELHDYSQFKQIALEFRTTMDAEVLDFYEMDKFIWVYGEEITQKLNQGG